LARAKDHHGEPANDASLFREHSSFEKRGPVECLGLTFPDDEERRKYFLEKLRDKLRDPQFRKMEGFPIGTDDDILALSDPPYYTACPNPFAEEFIRCQGRRYSSADKYHREPFAVDVSEGRMDQLYTAHSYHTKVPYKAIMRAILHYTNPGDLILDGFAGSGTSGVAAQMCGHPDAAFKATLESEWEEAGYGVPSWGVRSVMLSDLSPAASFIAANYNLPFDVDQFEVEARRVLDEVERGLGWMYTTVHRFEKDAKGREHEIMNAILDGATYSSLAQLGRVEYTVWSEVFTCSNCTEEVVFLDEALDNETQRVRESFPCPHCGTILSKDRLDRVLESSIDPATGSDWQRIKYVPSLISYTFHGKRHEKRADAFDLELLDRIAQLPLPSDIPTNQFPIEQMYHGSRIAPKGFTRVHHFFLPRAAQALGALWRNAISHDDAHLRHTLLFFVEQAIWGMSVLNRYSPSHFSQVNRQLSGVYYVASQHAEVSPWYNLRGKLRRMGKAFRMPFAKAGCALVATGTATRLNVAESSVDYVFTDPPFGENIFYADLNFLVESWYRVWTNTQPEAIIDVPKHKDLADYQALMQACFEEYCRVLKPGRWMTVVFHNSRNSVWTAIQEAMLAAGFVVADVRTLDKQQGSYRQVTSTAAKQDLVISAYKPNEGLEERFKLEAGTEDGVWDFARVHLNRLPVFVSKQGQAEIVAERQNYLLFDRMVAFHVQRGVTVPLSAPEFYQGLARRFPERDGMYFLQEQVAEYDKKRMTVKEVLQLELFVRDEPSAIQWLRQQLLKKPQTFQELHPQFLKEIGGWQKHEKPLELSELLQENFLHYDGKEEMPSQIHSYLSTNFKELRNLGKDELALRTRGKDRWYVAHPNRASDLEKLRERALLREFEDYRQSTQKRLKVFRLEAVRMGFRKAWQDRDYGTIIAVASRIPEDVLQEDPKLLMWYDQAVTRTGGG
jgi:hypothetical protein